MSKLPKPRIQMLTNISLSVFPRKLIPTKIHNTTLQKSSHLFSWWELQLGYVNYEAIRHRPFNLQGDGGGYGFLFRSEIFRTTRELEYFFPQNLTLGYMTKTLNQIIFFFLHQNQNFFSATLGIRIFFQKKNHNTPLQVKWSVPNQNTLLTITQPHGSGSD